MSRFVNGFCFLFIVWHIFFLFYCLIYLFFLSCFFICYRCELSHWPRITKQPLCQTNVRHVTKTLGQTVNITGQSLSVTKVVRMRPRWVQSNFWYYRLTSVTILRFFPIVKWLVLNYLPTCSTTFPILCSRLDSIHNLIYICSRLEKNLLKNPI